MDSSEEERKRRGKEHWWFIQGYGYNSRGYYGWNLPSLCEFGVTSSEHDPQLTLYKGGKYAHQIFHADVLPAILCPGSQYGLHDAFHARALEMEAIVRKEVGLEPSSSPSQRVPPSKLEQHSASTEPDQQERGKSL